MVELAVADPAGPPRPAPGARSWARRLALILVLAGLGLPLALLIAGRLLPPLFTPLMAIRLLEGEGFKRDWQPYRSIAPALVRSVIAAEDARFCEHDGFDWAEINKALDRIEAGGRRRGASSLSQQTAKNLFLWPGGGWARKGIEAWLTVLLELVWDKRRIIEVYLNIAEWGPGIYGAEAAAQSHFRKSAAALSPREAAALAAILPSPRRWQPARPGHYVAGRIVLIAARARTIPLGKDGPCP